MLFRPKPRHSDFAGKLAEIKARVRPEPHAWYRFNSLVNLPVLDRLLPNGIDGVPALTAGRPVADIGAADGDLAFLLESLGCKVTAIDWPPTNANQMLGLELLRRELNSAIEVAQIDIDDQFRLDGLYFGVTLCLGLLYHLKNPFYFLERLSRHTRHAFLSTRIVPRGKSSEAIAYLTADREFENDSTNFWFFSEAGMVRLLDRTGWDIKASVITGDGTDERYFCRLESRHPAPPPALRLLSGWHHPEEDAWRWTHREFAVAIENHGTARELELEFLILPELLQQGPVHLSATLNGTPLEPATFANPGEQLYKSPVDPPPGNTELRFALIHTFHAAGRDLGIIVRNETGLRLR